MNNNNNNNDRWNQATAIDGQTLFDIRHKSSLVIQQTSRVLNDIDKEIMKLNEMQKERFKTRAKAQAQRGQYENEPQNAWMMIKLFPKESAGYLCAGNRYSEQARQKRAIRVFKKI